MTISKGSPGTSMGLQWGVSGNGLYIAEGEILAVRTGCGASRPLSSPSVGISGM